MELLGQGGRACELGFAHLEPVSSVHSSGLTSGVPCLGVRAIHGVACGATWSVFVAAWHFIP